MTDRCDWPGCVSVANRRGDDAAKRFYLCHGHGDRLRGFRNLVLNRNELSPPARLVYEETKRALDELGIETESRTIGEWVREGTNLSG